MKKPADLPALNVSTRPRSLAVLSAGFSVLIAYAIYAAVLTFLKHLPGFGAYAVAVSCAVSIVLLGLVAYSRSAISSLGGRVGSRFLAINDPQWLTLCFVLGATLRCLTLTHCIPQQTSDFATYFGLAWGLAFDHIYAIADTRAYWPPGLPLELAPFVWMLGKHWAAPVVNNIFLLGLVLAITMKLGRRIVGRRGARVATLAVALWPNLIFAVGLADKQQLTMVLVASALYLYLRARDLPASQNTWRIFLVAGLCLGGAILTQPSHLLFPGALVLLELCCATPLRQLVSRVLPVIFGIFLSVSPWTVRNYLVLDRFVPVSNTGGISLYVGNNPDATGSYVAVSGLEGLDEVGANLEAGRRAVAWIRANPLAFAALVVPKNIAYLGDDSDGPFWSLKSGCGRTGVDYVLAKTISNLFWLALLLVVFASSLPGRERERSSDPAGSAVLILWFLYFFALHSVFESGGRHHVAPALGLIILASRLVERDTSQSFKSLSG